jgi:ElaB/YqjD/DUF883 family membrane-anchored ribosome-binding protein
VAIDQAQQGRAEHDAVPGKAQETVTQVKDQVQEKAEEVKEQASGRVHEQLDVRSTQLGEQVTSVAEALRKAAQHLETEGNDPGAKAANQAADQVERLGGYLTSSSSDRFLGDLERLGRERPWVSGALGAAMGFVGARFLKASSERRYDTSYRARQDADLPLSRDGGITAERQRIELGDPISRDPWSA